jgi:hypothetical protein
LRSFLQDVFDAIHEWYGSPQHEAPSYEGPPVPCRVVCASVRPSRPSVTSDKVHVRPIRANVLLTLNRVNLDLLCPRWLPHRCHIAATLNGRGCCGRIRLAEGRIRWWRGAYACRRGAYACPRGANVCARGAHSCLRGAYGFNMLLQKLTHTVV